MNCPKCNVVLQMTDRSGVEIDYCPQCRGVWLDRGELDKIIERTSQFAEGQKSTDYRDDDDRDERSSKGMFGQGGHGIGHRRERENPLMDLFDF